jgi:hypothetical protein
MKTKRTTKHKKPPVIPDSDRAEHEQLRQILADHQWERFADLRKGFNLSPQRLLYEGFSYPEIFELSPQDNRTPPSIRLREGELESREDILGRRQLVKLVRQAGAPGIYLRSLYTSSRYESETVIRLLADVKEIEAVPVKTGRFLYKWTGAKDVIISEPEKSRIQDSAPPAKLLPEPVGEQASVVLTKAQFRAQKLASAQARADAELAAERARRKAADDQAVALGAAAAAGDRLKDVIAPDELESMRWKTHSRDAERRRNNPVVAKYRGNAASNRHNPDGRYGIKLERG